MVKQKCAEINQTYDANSELTDMFQTFVLQADDKQLVRINPYQLAQQLNVDKKALLIHFFYAVKTGLFNLNWDIHCPKCDSITDEANLLKMLKTKSNCTNCNNKFDIHFDDLVKVTFTLNSNIKKIDINALEQAPEPSEAIISINLPRWETKTITVDLEPKQYIIECPITKAKGSLTGTWQQCDGIQQIKFSYYGDKFLPDKPFVAHGKTEIVISSNTNINGGFNLYAKQPFTSDADNADKVYGFHCSNIPEFRNLFAYDVLATDVCFYIKDMTILFTDISCSTELYDKLGTMDAFGLVRDHFDILFDKIENNEGLVVKTIGDSVMACFEKPTNSIKAVLEVQQAFDEYNTGKNDWTEEEVNIKMGIHTGSAIIVNLNNRLDFMGPTINMAARIKALGRHNEILISEDILEYYEVKKSLLENGITQIKRFKSHLKGIDGNYDIYKIYGD